MSKVKQYKLLFAGMALGFLLIAFSISAYGYIQNKITSNDCYLNIKSDFGAVGDGVTDDTQAFQNAFDHCSETHSGLYIPSGTYLVKNLTMNNAFNIRGENQYNTILKSYAMNGAAIYIAGKARMKMSNISLISNGGNEGLDFGIKIDLGIKPNYPGMMEFENIEVKGMQKENAIAFYMDDCSHMSFSNCNFTTQNGTAFRIDGTNYNTGVFDFKNTVFGSASSDKYGLEIKIGVAIDSISFEGCSFGGKISAEKIGNGNNMVRTIVHSACRFENSTFGDTQLVEVLGGGGLGALGTSWYNCTFSGYGASKYGITFRSGFYYGISIIDCEFNNINPAGFIINNVGTGAYRNCEFKAASFVTTKPKLFANATFRDDGGWIGGWTIKDTFTDMQKGLKVGGARVVTASSMPTWGLYYYPGDIVLNVSKPIEKGNPGKKYILNGWKRVTTGSSHILNVDWLEMRTPTGK